MKRNTVLPKKKLSITVDPRLVDKIDSAIQENPDESRSSVIEAALRNLFEAKTIDV